MEAVRTLRGQERRRAQRFFVFNERRSGFDRRRRDRSFIGAQVDAALVSLRDNPLTLIALLLIGNLLSLFDLVLTSILLGLGAAEANPLMRDLLVADPQLAAAVKVAVVAAISCTIWIFRGRRRVLAVAIAMPAFFSGLVLYEALCVSRVL
jgi:hypothetical protein